TTRLPLDRRRFWCIIRVGREVAIRVTTAGMTTLAIRRGLQQFRRICTLLEIQLNHALHGRRATLLSMRMAWFTLIRRRSGQAELRASPIQNKLLWVDLTMCYLLVQNCPQV